MKHSIITLLLLLLSSPAFCQDLSYEIRGRYVHPVKKERLKNVQQISDVIPGYPVSWIKNYVSVEVTTTCNGKIRKAVSNSDVLSTEQKNMLNWADLATDIIIDVMYKYNNSVTNVPEKNQLHISFTVVPEIEAEYAGGYEQMTAYLNENVIAKIPKTVSQQLQQVVVVFTVNENGEMSNAKISKTCGTPKIDKLLLDAITRMPKWNPAQNAKGIKVKQEFECSIGKAAGC